MNLVKKFNLSRVNFSVPVTAETDPSEVEKRQSFYRVQMNHLKKTAEHYDCEPEPGEVLPYNLTTYKDSDVLSWSAEEDMDLEFFPYQIVLAIRLTRPANKKRYKFIPTFERFFYANERLCLRVYS